MIVYLSLPVIIILDCIAWFLIHMGAAWGMTQLPPTIFKPDSWLYRRRSWEADGAPYRRIFLIHLWKKILPDGAALFKSGFRKKSLSSIHRPYLELFIRETCRGELTHWIVMASAPLFFIWNTAPMGIIMVVYAMIANVPCIVTQRYNRIRLGNLLMRYRDGTVEHPKSGRS